MKKLKSMLLSFVVLTVLLTACGNNSGKQEESKAKVQTDQTGNEVKKMLTIGVSLLTREHIYYNKIEEAMIETAKEKGFELIIQDAKSDANQQMNQIQDFITQHVDAIVLCPVNSSGLENGVKMAEDAGIPVFTMDVRTEGDVVCHVGIDNYEGGLLAADYANSLLDGVGEVALIGYDEVSSCADRSRGFADGLENYPGLKLVDNQNSSGNAEKSANIMQDMILKHPDLKLVFGVGDPFALGALQSITTANKEIFVIGFDGSDEAIDEIKKDGLFKATVWDNPSMLGELCLEKVRDYFDGKEVPEVYEYEPRMLDRDSIEE